jgi:thiol:disulfide interchange protein
LEGDKTMKAATAILLLLCGFVFYRFVHPSTTFAADGIDPAWDSAVQTRDQTEPTLVIFTAGWCGACQALHANVLSRSEIQDELYHHYNVVTVDLTSPPPQVQAHAHKLGVSAIPTLIRYDVQGHETDRTHGGAAENVLAWLRAGE